MTFKSLIQWLFQKPKYWGIALALTLFTMPVIVNGLFMQQDVNLSPLMITRAEHHEILQRKAEQKEIALWQSETKKYNQYVEQVQFLLKEKGFYKGELDGLDGPQTEEAILSFQRAYGVEENAFIDHILIEQIKISNTHKMIEKASFSTGSIEVPRSAVSIKTTTSTPEKKALDTKEKALDTKKEHARQKTDKGQAITFSKAIPLPKAAPKISTKKRFEKKSLKNIERQNKQEIGQQKIAVIQWSLSELGYAPGAIDGVIGETTYNAIRRFEFDRALEMSGQPSELLIEELQAVMGMQLPQKIALQ